MKSFMKSFLPLLIAGISLLSFTIKPGGEGFEVYLNKKLLLQRFGNDMNHPPTISLDFSSPQDELVVKYYHCGQTGKSRTLTIKDGQNKILKEFRYANTNQSGGMLCKASDIINLKKGNSSELKLYYTSSEIPGGRLLASLISNNATAAIQP